MPRTSSRTKVSQFEIGVRAELGGQLGVDQHSAGTSRELVRRAALLTTEP